MAVIEGIIPSVLGGNTLYTLQIISYKILFGNVWDNMMPCCHPHALLAAETMQRRDAGCTSVSKNICAIVIVGGKRFFGTYVLWDPIKFIPPLNYIVIRPLSYKNIERNFSLDHSTSFRTQHN
jgi:hypothetical protein